MRLFRRDVSRSKAILFSVETCLIFGVLYAISCIVYLYNHGIDALWLFDSNGCALRVLLVVIICQMSMYLNELYDYRITQGPREFMIRLLQGLGAACILLSIIYLIWAGVRIDQVTFWLGFPTIILCLFFWRQFYPQLMRPEMLGERVVILGDDSVGRKILEELDERTDAGFKVVARVTERDPEETVGHNPHAPGSVLSFREFPEQAKSLMADRIVVAIKDRRGKMPFQSLLNCRFRGIQVDEAASFYERLTGKILLDNIRPSWFIFSEGFRKSRLTLQVKRVSDIVMAFLLLLVAAPVMVLTAVLIKLDSRGPVIYKQDRVGEGWKDYTLYKFRSMVEDAEAMGAKWAEKNDPRVTRVGRVIRRYRIDELPQLFNVLKGDMSFVGPRPERRCFVEELTKEIPYYPYRLFVKPGITGWAQIKYHYGASKNETTEKLQYDLYYIKRMSLLFDLSILFDTVRVVLTGKGAR